MMLDWIKKAAKTVWNFLVRYPVALVVTVLVVIGAVLLLFFGVGDRFDVGGFLSKLWGKDDGEDPIEVANSIDEERTDDEGNPIPVGQADERGWVQEPVKKIETRNNPFRDKSKLKVRDSGGRKRTIKLPKGVKDTDVKEVYEVEDAGFRVKVKDRPDHGLTRDDLEEMGS